MLYYPRCRAKARDNSIPWNDPRPVRRSRVARSSAHDWKSCNGDKPFEGSNPSFSAKNKETPLRRFFVFEVRSGIRTGAREKTIRGIVFPRPDRAHRQERIPPSPPKRKSRVSGFFFLYSSLFSLRSSLFSPFSLATFSSEEKKEKRIGSFSLCEKHIVIL